MSPNAGSARAVVDQQRRAARRARSARRARRPAPPGPARLLERPRPSGASGSERRGERPARQAEGESAVRVQAHQPLGPAAGGAHELAGRQAVENSLATRSSGAVVGTLVEARVPARRSMPPSRSAWRARRGRAGLDQMQLGGVEERRRTRARARSTSAISVPSPGPELDQARRAAGGPASSQAAAAQRPISSPNIWLITGAVMKSPAAPSGSRRGVVAELRVVQAGGHVAGDA